MVTHKGHMIRGGEEVFRELGYDECLSLLAQVPVGRVAITVHALPVVLPVNYALMGHDIVFKTSAGTKLAAATAGSVVAFEADNYEEAGPSGWSVLVQGRAEEITDPAELSAAKSLQLDSLVLDGAVDHFVRIHPTRLSGRAVEPGP